jgi:hypothetical protein
MLLSHDVVVDLPYTPVKYSGRTIYAYPDRVCMAVLEYYAFAAGTNVQPEARANFRRLAAGGLKKFIYDRLGYKPVSQQELWQQFHDRVSLNFDSVPTGYFSVFKEIASVLVTLISAGVNVGKQVVPDISVGQHWSRHWLDQDLEERFGQRQKYEHNYPEYFPQADANPQTPYCYPDAALGEFRRWLQDVYLEVKLPVYFQSKVKEGKVIGPVGEAAIQALSNRPRARLIARSS